MQAKDIEVLNNIETMLLNNKTVLNLKEVCRYTGLSSSYIYKATSAKRIPHYKPSGKILIFKKDEIDEWLLRNQISTVDDIEQQAINYITNKSSKGGERW